MAETFGYTTKGSAVTSNGDYHFACKFTSGSAGDLVSISLYVKGQSDDTLVKCAIFDSSRNMLVNGTTEEKTVHEVTDDWIVFNFPTPPSVDATTAYWLAWWSNKTMTVYCTAGAAYQWFYDANVYNSWHDPLTPDYYDYWRSSIYATYEEAPPPAYIPKVIMIQCSPVTKKNGVYRRLKNLWVPQLRKLWLPRPPVGVPKGIMVT